MRDDRPDEELTPGELCQRVLDLVGEVQEREDLPNSAIDFIASVAEKAESVKGFYEERGFASDAQVRMINNMIGGVRKWLKPKR